MVTDLGSESVDVSELDQQERHRFKGACALERAGVDGFKADILGDGEDLLFSLIGVGGDEGGECLIFKVSGAHVGCKHRVESFDDLRLGKLLLKVFGGAGFEADGEVHIGVQGVGGVDDNLAGQVVSYVLEHSVDGEVGNGEDDDVGGLNCLDLGLSVVADCFGLITCVLEALLKRRADVAFAEDVYC